MEQKIKRYKKLIDKAASGLLIELGFEKLTNDVVIDRTSLSREIIEQIYKNDDMLRLAAMKVLAEAWCDKIRTASDKIRDKEEKVRYIVKEFAFGTDSHYDSLSIYVEALHRVISRADNSTYLVRELQTIYRMYVDLFHTCVAKDSIHCADYMNTCAWLLVVISDGLHMQSLLKNNLIKKDAAVNLLVSLIKPEIIAKESNIVGEEF